MKKILTYQDYVHNNGALLRRLANTFGPEPLGRCDALDIAQDCLTPDAVSMFIMPGGADLFFCEKLNGSLNEKIRSYVERGGTYLGICAGAYYASRRIEWAKDTDQAIVENRELGFFAGTAIGPLPYIESMDRSWSRAVTLMSDRGPSTALYRGGCLFSPDPDSHHKIHATYDLPGSPAAIVEIQIGEGRAILSGCHIEHTPDLLVAEHYVHRNVSPEWNENVIQDFSNAWSPETDMWPRLFGNE